MHRTPSFTHTDSLCSCCHHYWCICLWSFEENDWKTPRQQPGNARQSICPQLSLMAVSSLSAIPYLSSCLIYLFPSCLLIHGSQLRTHSSLSCISLGETLSVANLCVFCLDSPWKVSLSEVDPAVTETPVGGLTPARTYQFRLCAVNQVGRGQYSAETQR